MLPCARTHTPRRSRARPHPMRTPFDRRLTAHHACTHRPPSLCRLWGDVVKWGSHHKFKTAGECCDACLKSLEPKGNVPGCNGARFGGASRPPRAALAAPSAPLPPLCPLP